MTARLDYAAQSPNCSRSSACTRMPPTRLEGAIIDLVNIRASQLNGCGFMHVKEATCVVSARCACITWRHGVNQRCSARASAPAWPGPKY